MKQEIQIRPWIKNLSDEEFHATFTKVQSLLEAQKSKDKAIDANLPSVNLSVLRKMIQEETSSPIDLNNPATTPTPREGLKPGEKAKRLILPTVPESTPASNAADAGAPAASPTPETKPTPLAIPEPMKRDESPKKTQRRITGRGVFNWIGRPLAAVGIVGAAIASTGMDLKTHISTDPKDNAIYRALEGGQHKNPDSGLGIAPRLPESSPTESAPTRVPPPIPGVVDPRINTPVANVETAKQTPVAPPKAVETPLAGGVQTGKTETPRPDPTNTPKPDVTPTPTTTNIPRATETPRPIGTSTVYPTETNTPETATKTEVPPTPTKTEIPKAEIWTPRENSNFDDNGLIGIGPSVLKPGILDLSYKDKKTGKWVVYNNIVPVTLVGDEQSGVWSNAEIEQAAPLRSVVTNEKREKSVNYTYTLKNGSKFSLNLVIEPGKKAIDTTIIPLHDSAAISNFQLGNFWGIKEGIDTAQIGSTMITAASKPAPNDDYGKNGDFYGYALPPNTGIEFWGPDGAKQYQKVMGNQALDVSASFEVRRTPWQPDQNTLKPNKQWIEMVATAIKQLKNPVTIRLGLG